MSRYVDFDDGLDGLFDDVEQNPAKAVSVIRQLAANVQPAADRQTDDDDGLDGLFDEASQGATKMVSGIRPMADAAQQEAYRRADALAAAARSGGIRPRDDSMGAARRYAEHFARGQRAAEAFGQTHVGSAALQAKIDSDRRAQDLDWRKADQEAGIRRREIDMGVADTAMKDAGAVTQENVRGMWGVPASAAKVADTYGGIRQGALGVAGNLAAGEQNMKIEQMKIDAAAKMTKEGWSHEKKMAKLQHDFGIDAAKAAELIRQAGREYDASHPLNDGEKPVAGDGVIHKVYMPDGSTGYEKDGLPVDFDHESAKPYEGTLAENGIVVNRLDKHGRKKGLLDGTYDLYWDPLAKRWIVLSMKELNGSPDGPNRYLPGEEHDAETYWRIKASVRKEKKPEYKTV